jgi:hypothetical protein
METIKTPHDLKLKDGTPIPKGSTLLFVRHYAEGTLQTVGVFSYKGRELRMRYRHVIKVPSVKRIDKWVYDSVCESVFGNTCEPDGYGSEGEPSWLLALGLV